MKIGVVDIGTNSVRLMIGNYEGEKLQSKEKQLYSTRIGQGVDHTGELSEAAMDRTVKALESIRVQMEQLGVQKVYAYATSAVRQAKNKEVFLDRVKEKTGYEVKVLSGEEEAEYGFLGVMKSVALENGLIVDVGGGSTELIEVQNRQRKRLVSLDIGAVRLYERCKVSDPMRKEEIRCVQAEIERALRKWNRETEAKNLVAIGGTATTIASMHLRLKEYDSQKIN
ncbi:MAG TPA: hypothetical protein DHN33_11210, partial [Eubacteriaceae bacterium]|nr:hypothetical protein [Eubacteriaceae bacterium]